MGVVWSIHSHIKFECGKIKRGQGTGTFRGQKSWPFAEWLNAKKKSVCVEVFDKPCRMCGWGLFLRKWPLIITLPHYLEASEQLSPLGFTEPQELSGEVFTASYRPVILRKGINYLYMLQ